MNKNSKTEHNRNMQMFFFTFVLIWIKFYQWGERRRINNRQFRFDCRLSSSGRWSVMRFVEWR